MAVFLPVPPHQLFPSGGFLTFTLQWAAISLAHFFCLLPALSENDAF
jgi:hypothetical protein